MSVIQIFQFMHFINSFLSEHKQHIDTLNSSMYFQNENSRHLLNFKKFLVKKIFKKVTLPNYGKNIKLSKLQYK